MKIGIFGDSYVDRWNPAHRLARQCLDDNLAEKFCNDNPAFPWYTHLPKMNNTYKVFEHGLGGCDNWYIYSQFLEHHEKYDKIIVVWTHDGRYSWTTYEEGFPYDPEEIQNRHWLHAVNLDTAIDKSKNYCDEGPPVPGVERYRADYKALIPFFERVHHADRKRHLKFSQLLQKEVRETRPDAIFINAFNPSGSSIDHSGTLQEITLYENHLLYEDWPQMGEKIIPTFWSGAPPMDEIIDCRICHMTKNSNVKFAEKVLSAINYNHTNIQIIVNDFWRKMEKKDYREFWTRRDILKYANTYYNAGITIG